jgi:hypothetical protein
MKICRSGMINLARVFGLVVAVAFLAINCASAQTNLLVSESGVWGPLTPSTDWTAPNESWSFSFITSSTPATSNVTHHSYGSGFDETFSDFSYTLNGSTVATTPTGIRWYSTGLGGLFNVDLAGDFSFEPEGDQAYTGSESAPTIIPGTYTLGDYSGIFLLPSYDLLPLTGEVTITQVSAPEGGSSLLYLLLAAAFCGAAVFLRSRMHFAAHPSA